MDKLVITRESGAAASTAILRPKGPLTLATVFALEEKLREAGDLNTILDLSEINYIDSAGLGTILSGWSHMQRIGRRFALSGVPPRITLLLEITKFNSILPIFPTAAEAEQSFSGRAGAGD